LILKPRLEWHRDLFDIETKAAQARAAI